MEKKKELKVCGSCLSGNIGKKFHESDFDMRFKKGHKLAGIDFCLDCGSDDIYTVKNLLDKAREEGRKELLDSIIEGVTQLKDLVSMFNPMSPEIRAKQSGEIEAYDYSATTNGIMEAIGKIEQEAERRGEQRVLKAVYDCRLDEYIDMAQVRRKLKLLEEENGKQNAR